MNATTKTAGFYRSDDDTAWYAVADSGQVYLLQTVDTDLRGMLRDSLPEGAKSYVPDPDVAEMFCRELVECGETLNEYEEAL